MTIIRHDLVSGALSDPSMPRVGYRNLFRDGILTSSSASTGHPKELAIDGLTSDAWESAGNATESLQVEMPGATAADYMAVAAHTLAGATVTPQRSTNGTSWTSLHAAYLVPDNRPIVWEWTSVSDVHWRLLITDAPGRVSIGALHVGEKLTMQRGLPVGWRPPSFNEDVVYTNIMSQGGQILGRNIIRRGVNISVDGNHAEYVWAREEWMDFISVAELYAFFFWWAQDGKAESMYGVMSSHEASFSTEHLVSTKFSMAGIMR